MSFVEDHQKLLKLSPTEFDQGEEGFRALVGNVSEAYIANLILSYIERNRELIISNNKLKHKDHYLPLSLLYFHAGQAFAGSGSKYYSEAIECFEKGYEDEDKDAQECWNAYVNGTIAFLNKDSAKILDQIRIVEKSNAKNKAGGNIELLKKFSMALDKGIVDYLRACTMPPSE